MAQRAHKATKTTNSTILYRSETNKVVAGVCGGLGEVFGIDPTVLRVLFLLAFVLGGTGFLLYILLWVVVPSESKVLNSSDENIRANIDEMKDKAQSFANDFNSDADNSRKIFALIIVGMGVVFLLGNFGFSYIFNFEKLWPLLLVVLGVYLLGRKKTQ